MFSQLNQSLKKLNFPLGILLGELNVQLRRNLMSKIETTVQLHFLVLSDYQASDVRNKINTLQLNVLPKVQKF